MKKFYFFILFLIINLKFAVQSLASQQYSLLIPSFGYTTATTAGKGSGFSEIGLGLEGAFFINHSWSIFGRYEVDFSLYKKSLIFNGTTFGVRTFLIGGDSTHLKSDSFEINAYPVFQWYLGLGIAQRDFDFSSFDRNKNVTYIIKERVNLKGTTWSVYVANGCSYALLPQFYVGMEGFFTYAFIVPENFALMSFGAYLTLGYSL